MNKPNFEIIHFKKFFRNFYFHSTNISELLVHPDQTIRRDERFDDTTTDFDLDQKIKQSLSMISTFDQNGKITSEQINLIGQILIQLQSPEEYGFNFFLIRLLSQPPNFEISNSSFLVLSNNFEGGRIKLKSFNPSALATDACFAILIQLLSSNIEKRYKQLSISIIISVFETMTARDFISLEIYGLLFDYILNNQDSSNEIFSAIIIHVEQINPNFYPVINTILLNYLSNPSSFSNNNASAALFGICHLMSVGLEVPQELLALCSQIFVTSLDEQLIPCILFIMTKLKEPPFFAFNKILDITENCDSEISYIAIKILVQFCTQWADDQKEMLVSHLLKSYSNLYCKSTNLAMYILLKLSKTLPSDPKFFSDLISCIKTCNYKVLSLASAQIIIVNWFSTGLDEEKMGLISDFQTIVEDLIYDEDMINDGNDDFADICHSALSDIQLILSCSEN